MASPAAPHRSVHEVFPHTALRRCSCDHCRARVIADTPREAVHTQLDAPVMRVHLAPSTPAALALLTIEERQTLMYVTIDLGKLPTGVASPEVVGPASQYRVELGHQCLDRLLQPGSGSRDRLDLGPNTGHGSPRRPALAVPPPAPPGSHQA